MLSIKVYIKHTSVLVAQKFANLQKNFWLILITWSVHRCKFYRLCFSDNLEVAFVQKSVRVEPTVTILLNQTKARPLD